MQLESMITQQKSLVTSNSGYLGEYCFPEEIWSKIILFCSLDETLALEKTCKTFRELISSRHIWIHRLQELDQDHAPNLLPHVSLSSLSWSMIRDLVIKAKRRHDRCSGPSAPRPTREISVDIGQTNKDGTFGQPVGWGSELFLVPGGEYLVVKWPKGHLQCWNVRLNECVWTYPSLQGRRVCNFACEIQGETLIFAIISEGIDRDERTIEVYRLDQTKNTAERIFCASPAEIDAENGLTFFIVISGDVLVTYTELNLVVCFWRQGRWTVVKGGSIDSLDIKNDHLLAVISCYPTSETSSANKLIAVPMNYFRKYVQDRTDVIHSTLRMNDVPFATCDITPPGQWICGRAQFSACNLHWKNPQEQKIVITVVGDLYRENDTREWPVVEFFSFSLDINSASSGQSVAPQFTTLGSSRALLGDCNYNSYSVLSSPSQARATVIAFHVDNRRGGERTLRAYTYFSKGKEVKISELDEKFLGHKPATHSLNVEFYSGAIYYLTADKQKIVIQYFD